MHFSNRCGWTFLLLRSLASIMSFLVVRATAETFASTNKLVIGQKLTWNPLNHVANCVFLVLQLLCNVHHTGTFSGSECTPVHDTNCEDL